MARAAATAAVLLSAAASPATAATVPPVPPDWLGVAADGPINFAVPEHAGEWARMREAGATSVRVAFFGNAVRPHRTWADVPPGDPAARRYRDVGGVPTDYAPYDGVVAAAARERLTVLPVVQRMAPWGALRPELYESSPPRSPLEYASLLRALVARYGPEGTFWAEHPELPKVPIRDWQIWNEPNVTQFWSEAGYAGGYVPLLQQANRTLKRADPDSRTILAGLTYDSWAALQKLYDAGARGAFDAIAVHPYSGSGTALLRIIGRVRDVARRAGDGRVPIWITEFSWPASAGLLGSEAFAGMPTFQTDHVGQARRLADTLPRLARSRVRLGIERVFWYTWLSDDVPGLSGWDHSGLRRVRGERVVNTPAYDVFRRMSRVLRGCGDPVRPRACRVPGA